MSCRLASLVFTVMTWSSVAFGQSGLLPRGIGLYQVSYRSFADQSHRYDAQGERVPLSDRLAKDFNGTALLDGKGGASLQRLAEEVSKFDSDPKAKDSLVNSMRLGRLDADVKAKVNATVLGLAYGLGPRWTLFTGVPYVVADVKVKLRYQGENNAAQIKERLGELAFEELKAGLDQAAAMNTSAVSRAITNEGYAPLEHWSKSGFGDVRIGAKTAFRQGLMRPLVYSGSLTTTLLLPTGATESPDVLTDVDFGTGYYSLAFGYEQVLHLPQNYHVGLNTSYSHNFNSKRTKRVPETDETIVTAERKTTVTHNPGDDTAIELQVGKQWRGIKVSTAIGQKRHYGDRFHGSLAGGYAALARHSDSEQAYHKAAISYDTVRAYKNQRALVPFIIELSGYHPLVARNAMDERYIQLSLTSFFKAQ